MANPAQQRANARYYAKHRATLKAAATRYYHENKARILTDRKRRRVTAQILEELGGLP